MLILLALFTTGILAKLLFKLKKINTNMGKAITKACLLVERSAKENMSPDSPSEPGQPPAVVTGRLRASITHRLEGGGNEAETTGYVGTNVEYAKWLEFGTSKMEPRPFLTPALELHRGEIRTLIDNAKQLGLRGDNSD